MKNDLQQKRKTPSTQKKKQRPYKNSLKFAGLGLQLLITILIAVFAGYWLDSELGLTFPWFTIFLTLAVFGGSIYQLYKTLTEED